MAGKIIKKMMMDEECAASPVALFALGDFRLRGGAS
jgi:hypothetical protein